VKDLKERVQKLEGSGPADSRAAEELQAIIDYQI
jgi:hypothetical protein